MRNKLSLKGRKNSTFKFYGVDIPLYRNCPECGSKASCEFRTYGYPSRCPKCQRKKDKKELKTPTTFRIGRIYKEPVAFGYDKATGKPVAIDHKGRHFDPSLTRYDLKNDPKGWRATGKV